MNICRRYRIAAVLLIAACCALSTAQAAETPGPPAPPMRGMSTPTFHTVQVGPNDSTITRKMRGKMTVLVVVPANAGVKSVEVLLDGRSVGKAESAPYRLQVDATTVTDGAHTLKAVGRDASGKDVWNASTQVEVVNSRTAARERPAPGAVAGPTPGLPPQASKGPAAPNRPARPTRPVPKPAAPLPAGMSLDRTYSSSDYGFSIRYPAAWTFKDETAVMKPKTPGGFHLVFGTYPIEKSALVVNVRRVKLEPGTDAAKFATFNSFVKKWESTTILGSPAFSTTGRTTGPRKGAVHRVIIIKDGYAWMLNCVDTSGKPAADSRALFDAMINTVES